jgi:hypothetical protein
VNNIRKYIVEIKWSAVDWTGKMDVSCELGNEPSGSIKF